MKQLALVAALIAALETNFAIVKSRLRPEYEWAGRGRTAATISKYSFVIGIVLVALVSLGSS